MPAKLDGESCKIMRAQREIMCKYKIRHGNRQELNTELLIVVYLLILQSLTSLGAEPLPNLSLYRAVARLITLRALN